MKHTILLLSFVLLSLKGLSIVKISYEYDKAGNRISRQYIIETRSSVLPVRPELPDSIPVDEGLGQPKIIVYPNPTKGPLELEVTGYDPGKKIYLKLFSPQGSILKNTTTNSGRTKMDLSPYPSGWYLLHVLVGKKTVEFKIIKE